MSRPPKGEFFLGDITQKHCICFENTFWEIRLKIFKKHWGTNVPNISLKNEEYFEEHLPKTVIQQFPTDPWGYFFSGSIFQNHSQKLFNIFLKCFSMVLEGTCQKKLQGSVGELFADHLWEIFPEIFVREILGTFVPQCFLKMLSGMPPRRYFQNKCGVLGDISQNMFLPLGEASSEGLLETNYHPEGFQREICQTDSPWGMGWCHITP